MQKRSIEYREYVTVLSIWKENKYEDIKKEL